MRTTIDLPDSLFRRAKATAAMRGLKLKELFVQILESGLTEDQEAKPSRRPERKLPTLIARGGPQVASLSNAEIEAAFLQEDIERLGLDRSA